MRVVRLTKTGDETVDGDTGVDGDPRLADYTNLRGLAQRQRAELAAGIFIAEGIAVIERLLDSAYSVRSLLLHDRMFERLQPRLEGRDVDVFVAERNVLETITGFDLHRGALAVAERGTPLTMEHLIAPTASALRTVIAVEGLNDGENLGVIARSARALGADALLCDPTTIDPLYRRTVRVSMGEILFLPSVRSTCWPADLGELRRHGLEIAAMTPSAGAISLLDWQPTRRTVILVGAEGPGLSEAAIAAADLAVRIPIRSDVDSLNVGHAAAIALHHVSVARHQLPGTAATHR